MLFLPMTISIIEPGWGRGGAGEWKVGVGSLGQGEEVAEVGVLEPEEFVSIGS